jgi:UDP-N-acetylmuramoyl-tripeptide--D-alanyl-D-alanine ligase
MLGDKILLVGGDPDADYGSAATTFTLTVFGEKVPVTTTLLGNAAVENIRLAAQLCIELGMTADEIVRGIEKLEQVPHRLELLENNGVYILDDGYNCNPKGAEEALRALSRFVGRKCIVTPGIIECGILEEKINGELGEKIAKENLDKVILVGDTLVGTIKAAYEKAGGNMEALTIVRTLDGAKALLGEWVQKGDAILFLNDLPDFY